MKKDTVLINEEFYQDFTKSCVTEKISHEFLFKEDSIIYVKLAYESATDLINLGRCWGVLLTIKN